MSINKFTSYIGATFVHGTNNRFEDCASTKPFSIDNPTLLETRQHVIKSHSFMLRSNDASKLIMFILWWFRYMKINNRIHRPQSVSVHSFRCKEARIRCTDRRTKNRKARNTDMETQQGKSMGVYKPQETESL